MLKASAMDTVSMRSVLQNKTNVLTEKIFAFVKLTLMIEVDLQNCFDGVVQTGVSIGENMKERIR